MPYLTEFLTIVVIHLLAVASPGPDFALIVRNSVMYSRRMGVWSAVGLSLGILTHVAYSLLGIGFIISQSIVLFSIIKFLGAGYLIYIGIKSLRAKQEGAQHAEVSQNIDMTLLAAVKMGYLTNILNPKVTLFIFSVFTQVIDPATPLMVQLLYGFEMAGMTLLWFSMVATVLNHPAVRRRFQGIQHYVEKVMGAVLIALGLRLAFASSK